MPINVLEDLYEFYKKERTLNLNLEQFTMFVEFFPALLVIMSDGILDSEEEAYIEKLSHNMGNSFLGEGLSVKKVLELNDIFKTEFQYLMQNLDYWQDHFLNSLKNHLHIYPTEKEIILETLYLFAKKSKEERKEENKTIDFLKGQLDL